MEYEEIIPKKELKKNGNTDICIRFASKAFNTNEKNQITDISEKGIQEIIKNVYNGDYKSLCLSLDPDGETDGGRYFIMESDSTWISLEIVDEINKVCYSSFNTDYMDSEEESPIKCSDGQSVILKKYTMHNRKLAAECVEWFIRTGRHYPGMEWLKSCW